jgi:hypothetical protein
MKYARAIDKLRTLAERCQEASRWRPDEEPFVRAAYVFGEVLDGTDPLDVVQVVVAVNLAPEDVPWGSNPRGTGWLAVELELDKVGCEYWWRSHLDSPWNHYIHSSVRIWSLAGGAETAVLDALASRRLDDLPRLTPSDVDRRLQRRDELDNSVHHLREVRDKYWDRDWRREHRGNGRYPENELWEAVHGYLHVLDAGSPASRGDGGS